VSYGSRWRSAKTVLLITFCEKGLLVLVCVTVQLAVVDQEIEAQFQAGVDLANTTAQRLQELVEVKSEELSSFKEQSAKAVSALSDKIANEEEQLRMKREHVELDEKLVQEEQQQVDDAIEGQTSENLALARELEEKHVMLDMEIAELEAKLERLRQEDASTVAKLAEVREKVTSIRGKYSKQLDRLKAKRSVVDSEKRECQAEADGIARVTFFPCSGIDSVHVVSLGYMVLCPRMVGTS
jgi:chromosome segregation ATPase